MKETELKKLYARSGNSCAFPDCRQPLVPEAAGYDQVVLGEAAHIVAEARSATTINSFWCRRWVASCGFHFADGSPGNVLLVELIGS